MHVTGLRIRPGVDDRDDRAVLPFLRRIAHLHGARAMTEGPKIVRSEPARAAQPGGTFRLGETDRHPRTCSFGSWSMIRNRATRPSETIMPEPRLKRDGGPIALQVMSQTVPTDQARARGRHRLPARRFARQKPLERAGSRRCTRAAGRATSPGMIPTTISMLAGGAISVLIGGEACYQCNYDVCLNLDTAAFRPQIRTARGPLFYTLSCIRLV
jgi:hypothetical protein